MAKKSRSEWSEAYRRRVERAEAAGKSRQAARGHKSREHVARKERELKQREYLGLPTTSERAVIRKFAHQQAKRTGDDPTALGDRMIEYATTRGVDRFKTEMARQRGAAADYRRAMKRGTYASIGMSFLEDMAEDGGFPEPRWYFYH
jgi:hypothetical protein